MDVELSEGEIISDSESTTSDKEVASWLKNSGSKPGQLAAEANAAGQLPRPSNPVSSYRSHNGQLTDSDEDSSSDGYASTDDYQMSPGKRQRRGAIIPRQSTSVDEEDVSMPGTSAASNLPTYGASADETSNFWNSAAPPAKKKKVNNIWSTVLQEQTLSSDLGAIGMTRIDRSERGEESYDYSQAKFDKRPNVAATVEEVSCEASGEVEDGAVIISEGDDMEEFPQKPNSEVKRSRKRKHQSDDRFRKENFRKRSAKERLGKLTMEMLPVKADDSPEVLATFICQKLEEENSKLVELVVRTIHGEKSLATMMEAWNIEHVHGGEMINNNTRRRTPGGIFLRLLKDAEWMEKMGISNDDKKTIFAESYNTYCEHRKTISRKKKKARKRWNLENKKTYSEFSNERLDSRESPMSDVAEATEISGDFDDAMKALQRRRDELTKVAMLDGKDDGDDADDEGGDTSAGTSAGLLTPVKNFSTPVKTTESTIDEDEMETGVAVSPERKWLPEFSNLLPKPGECDLSLLENM